MAEHPLLRLGLDLEVMEDLRPVLVLPRMEAVIVRLAEVSAHLAEVSAVEVDSEGLAESEKSTMIILSRWSR